MNFHKVSKGHYGSYGPDDDMSNIVKNGREWELKIVNRQTGDVVHSFKATKEYICEQEANRFYGHGAYGESSNA